MRGKLPVGRAAFLLSIAAVLLPGCVIQHGEFTNAGYRKVVTEKGVPSVRFEADFAVEGIQTEQLMYEVSLLDSDGRPLRSQNGRYQNRSGHVTAGRALLSPGGKGIYTRETVLLPVNEVEAPERRPARFARYSLFDLNGNLIVQHDIPFKLRAADYERARAIEDFIASETASPDDPRDEADSFPRETPSDDDRSETEERAVPSARSARRTPEPRDESAAPRRETGLANGADGELSDANVLDADTPEARRNRARIAQVEEPGRPEPARKDAEADSSAAQQRASEQPQSDLAQVAPAFPAGRPPQASRDVPVRDLQPVAESIRSSDRVVTTDRESAYVRRRPLGPTGEPRSDRDSLRRNEDQPETAGGISPKEEFRTHEVRKGETLSGIAQELLGSATRWPEIYRLNESQLDGPDFIPLGTVLRIPPK